jgi:hypothetical protein
MCPGVMEGTASCMQCERSTGEVSHKRATEESVCAKSTAFDLSELTVRHLVLTISQKRIWGSVSEHTYMLSLEMSRESQS